VATRPAAWALWMRTQHVVKAGSCIICFLRVKHWDGGGWRKLVRLDVKRGAHGVTRPTIRGWARRWMIVGAFMDVSSCKKCYFGVFRWFCLGHRPWPDELRGAGKHARAPGDAMPQSACSAGKQSVARPCPPQESGAGMVASGDATGSLGALDESVTCCKIRHLHNVFLKGEALGWRRLEKACPLACQARRARSDAPYHLWVGEALDDCGCVHGCLKL